MNEQYQEMLRRRNPYGQRPGDPNQVLTHQGITATRQQHIGYGQAMQKVRLRRQAIVHGAAE